VGCAALGLAVAAAALLGPLVTGTIRYRVAPVLRDQLAGSDAVSLGVLAPLAVLAAVLLRRRSPAGALLAPAVALAAWYLAAELVLGPDRSGRQAGDDEAWLPLFLLVLLLGGAVAIGALRRLPAGRVRFDPPTRRLLGGLLLAVVALHVLARYLPAWLGIVAGRGPDGYAAGPGVWWAVAFEDLALLLPAAAGTAVGLLRGSRWSGEAAFAVGGALALVAAAVTGMAWSTTLHRDPGATVGSALLMTGVGALSAAPGLVCWSAWVRSARRDRRAALRAPTFPAAVPLPRAAPSDVPAEEFPC
jgi:hypothetical protein